MRMRLRRRGLVIEAIEARDAERAGEVVRAHLRVFGNDVAQYALPEGMDVELGG